MRPVDDSLPSEAHLLIPTLRGLLRTGFCTQMSPAALELPWHQKRIDLAALSAEHGIVLIELKVSAWRRAIAQAFVNRWCADASWVAVWHRAITPAVHSAASDAGVGLLIVVTGTVYPMVLPKPPPRGADPSVLRTTLREQGTRLRDLLGHAGEAARCTG